MNRTPHEKSVQALQQQLAQAHGEGVSVIRGKVAGKLPHATHRPSADQKSRVIPVSSLNNILGLEGTSVWVEPCVSMEQLCRWTLKRDLIPEVVCEFKGITVGGAVMGAALESSSFLHGQFSDTCEAYELLLGDGRLITACAKENPELFYGVSGSYGSLASLTLAKVRLTPAKGMVRLRYHIVDGHENIKKKLEALCQTDPRPDYLDGVVLDDQRAVLMAGYQVSAEELPPNVRLERLEGFWRPWFIQHLIERLRFKTAEEVIEDYFPLLDYLFRFDRAAFWMGQFCTGWRSLARYLTHWNISSPDLLETLRKAEGRGTTTLTPSLFFRLLCGWKLSSSSLYKVLHALSPEVLGHKFLIQDFYVPTEGLPAFLGDVRREAGIYPLWLCPIRGTTTPQFLSPHYQETASRWPLPDFVNVGAYGVPNQGRAIPDATRALESLVHQLGGRKMLYALNYIPEDEFWKVYDRVRYLALRREAVSEGCWRDFYDKTHNPTTLKVQA